MIEGLRPYPEMRSTRLEWLAELPADWEIHRAKYSFREVDDRSKQGGEELLSVSHKTGVTPRSQKNITMFMAESYEGHKVCRPGDVVVNTMWAWMAAIGVSRHFGIVSPAYGVYRPRTFDRFEPKYLDYLVRTETYRAEYLRSSRGVTTSRLRLYPPDFLNIPFVQPPLEEQRLIVRFLDWHGSQTAKLVRAKKKLIALLNEQKQAVIHRAVTRGLDPNVKLKTSGNPWLGDIPEGWEAVTLRRVIRHAVDGPHHSPNYLDEGIPFLSARNVKVDRWSLEDLKYISEADYAQFCRRAVPQVGDVLYTKGGTTGVARVVDLEFRFQVWVHIAILKVVASKIVPSFLAAALNSPRCYEQSQLFTRGATNQDLGLGRMKGIFLALPPLSEQVAILAVLDDENRNANEAIDRISQEIVLLQELRTRLIADVVTGKLDVRAPASSLPEIIEPEAISEPIEDVDELTDDTEDEEVAA